MSLYYQEFGAEAAPTIVFIHAGGVSGWMWQPQIERLQSYHCLVPDLPEQGQSLNTPPFTIQSSAALIADLIRAKGHGGKAHVVGLSVGAQVALALLNLAPELVDRAIISSALVRPLPGSSMMTSSLIALSYRWFIAPFKHSEWWIRLNMNYSAGIPETYYSAFRQSFQATTESGFTNLMVENQRFRLPTGLKRVNVPTLVVAGKREKAPIRQSVLDIAAALPAGRAYEVHHTRKLSGAEEHNWSLTEPELFTQTVIAWVNDQPLPQVLRAVQA